MLWQLACLQGGDKMYNGNLLKIDELIFSWYVKMVRIITTIQALAASQKSYSKT